MKLVVHIPLQADREYIEDFDENTFPKIGDNFDKDYIVVKKEFMNEMCEITVRRNEVRV